MSLSFHRRYTQGEYATVCQELADLGERVYERQYFDDATAVATELVDRSISNLNLLHSRLNDIGFTFFDPNAAFVFNTGDEAAAVTRFEDAMGRAPMLASTWYSRIRSVDFTQCVRQFGDKSSDVGGLGWHAELVFQSLDRATDEWHEFRTQVQSDHEHFAKQDIEMNPDITPILFTGGCASNNDGKGFELPCSAFDGVMYNDGGGDICMHDELRAAFLYAGFPILVAWEKYGDQLKYLYPRPNIERLLPLLTADLLPV